MTRFAELVDGLVAFGIRFHDVFEKIAEGRFRPLAGYICLPDLPANRHAHGGGERSEHYLDGRGMLEKREGQFFVRSVGMKKYLFQNKLDRFLQDQYPIKFRIERGGDKSIMAPFYESPN